MKYNTQNAKIASITEKTLIVGIDVGSETHFARAFDWRNYEYTKKPLEFSNSRNGADRSLLVCTGEIPAGQRDEACTCESAPCQEVERAG